MENADIGDPVNYRAKLANASCRTARSGLRFREKSSSPEAPVFFGFGKNHPRRRLRYFSRKPCLSGSIRRPAPVVQRAAKARVFTLNNKDYATSDHHKTTVTGPDRDARGKKTESAHPAAGNQAAAKRKRSGTYLQTVEPDTGNMQPSRQGQAAGGVLQGRLKILSNHLILKLCFLHSSTN